MAPVNTTALRLIHVVKSTFLSNKIVVQNLRTIENSFLKQYVRAYSKEFETQPANSFGVPQEIRKKTVQIQKVLLLSEEGKVVEQLTMEQATHLAKRRNLNLVKVVDISLKSSLPTYQLMSKLQLFDEQVNAKKQKNFEKDTAIKQTKDFVFSNKIEAHDLETKIKKMIKLLVKHHKVRIFVTMSGNKDTMEENIKLIEKGIGENGKLSKTVKANAGVKLYFDPIITSTSNEAEKEETCPEK